MGAGVGVSQSVSGNQKVAAIPSPQGSEVLQSTGVSSCTLAVHKKKTMMWILPSSPSEFQLICCIAIDKGGDSCSLRKDCKINHQGERVDLAPGDVVVMKRTDEAFSTLKLSKGVVDDEVLGDWVTKTTTPAEWNHLFSLHDESVS